MPTSVSIKVDVTPKHGVRLEEPIEEELKEATKYMAKIRSNPQEFERWVDR